MTRYDSFYDRHIILNNVKFIEIDPNLLLASLSCELGQQNNQISLHGGQASGTYYKL